MKNLIDEINLIITEITTYFETEKDFWIKILNENDGKVLNQYRVNLIQLIENEEITKLNILLTDFDKLKQYLKGDLDENSNQLIRYLKQELENLKRIKGYLMSSQEDILKNKDFIIQEINYLNNLLRITNTAGKNFKSTLNTLIDKKNINENDRNERLNILIREKFPIEDFKGYVVNWNSKQIQFTDLLITDLWIDFQSIYSHWIKIGNGRDPNGYLFKVGLPEFFKYFSQRPDFHYIWDKIKRLILSINVRMNIVFIFSGDLLNVIINEKYYYEKIDEIFLDIIKIANFNKNGFHSERLFKYGLPEFLARHEVIENYNFYWEKIIYFTIHTDKCGLLFDTSFLTYLNEIPLFALLKNPEISSRYDLIKKDLVKIVDIGGGGASFLFVYSFKLLNNPFIANNFDKFWKDILYIVEKNDRYCSRVLSSISSIFEKYANSKNFEYVWYKLIEFSDYMAKNKVAREGLNELVMDIVKVDDYKTFEDFESFLLFAKNMNLSEYRGDSLKNIGIIFLKLYRNNPKSIQNLFLLNGWLEERHFDTEAFYSDIKQSEIYNDFDLKYFKLAIALLKYKKIFPNPDILIEMSKKNILPNKNDILKYREDNYDKWQYWRIYSNMRKKVDYKYSQISMKLNYVNYKNGKYTNYEKITHDIIDEFRPVMYWTALEIFRIENFIRNLRKESSRKILVIGNLRLGRNYVSPLKRTLKGISGLKYAYAKIGSSPFHETYTETANPFDRGTWKLILKEKPHIIIIDASINNRFPDAYKGYLNFFSAMNMVFGSDKNLLGEIIKKSEKSTRDNDMIENSFDEEISFKNLKSVFAKTIRSGNYKREYPYYPFLIAHPKVKELSLIRDGGRGSKREYVEGVNNTDLVNFEYTTNLVSDNFFKGFKGNLGLFLINAQFPFLEIYGMDKTSEIIYSMTGFKNDYSKSQKNYNFDDKDDYLPHTLTLDENNKLLLNDEEMIKELTKIYLEVKQKLMKKD